MLSEHQIVFFNGPQGGKEFKPNRLCLFPVFVNVCCLSLKLSHIHSFLVSCTPYTVQTHTFTFANKNMKTIFVLKTIYSTM